MPIIQVGRGNTVERFYKCLEVVQEFCDRQDLRKADEITVFSPPNGQGNCHWKKLPAKVWDIEGTRFFVGYYTWGSPLWAPEPGAQIFYKYDKVVRRRVEGYKPGLKGRWARLMGQDHYFKYDFPDFGTDENPAYPVFPSSDRWGATLDQLRRVLKPKPRPRPLAA